MSPLLEFDEAEFRAGFGRGPFQLRHRLADHALFDLARLIGLARLLPASSVEYNAGDVPLGLDPARTPRTGLGVEETLRRIEECGSWLVLKNVEQDADYHRLLEECLAEVRRHSESLAPGMTHREGYIFISSPRAITPYHIDPEQNFLLQIRGRKRISLCDGSDRRLLSEIEIENFYSGAHRNLAFRDACRTCAHSFDLEPGMGVHVPVTMPHWVENGDQVSVSFSITFQTRASLARSHAYGMNAQLRKWGWEPAPIGRSPLRDRLKALGFRAKSRTERWLGTGRQA